MDPCPFARVLVGNLALKLPTPNPNLNTSPSQSQSQSQSPSRSRFFCKIKFGKNPSQLYLIPPEPDSNPLAAVFDVGGSAWGKRGGAWVKVLVYSGRRSGCGMRSSRLVGVVSVPVAMEGRSAVVHDGWVAIGKKVEVFLTVRIEQSPRFVFQFDGEPECSPQVFQIQGSDRQAVFTCKFSCRSSVDRRSSSMSEPSTSRSCLSSMGSDKDLSVKERKGWSVTIHDLSGSPVAAASMVTPFVPSPGSDRVSKSNPGAWLILRPGDNTWKPWGRLEAWREKASKNSLGYKFELIPDAATGTPTTATVSNSTISMKKGGKFTIDTTNTVTPTTSPHSSCDFGSRSGSGSGSGSGSDFGLPLGLWPNLFQKGFIMSSTVDGSGKGGKPVVEVGVRHVACTEDAAAFVALAAAMDLSMDACRLFSQKLRKELRQQSHDFVL